MSDLFSSLLIFTIIKTISSTFFFTVSKFYKNPQVLVDRTLPPFSWTSIFFFSSKQHFATLCTTGWHIYTKYKQTVHVRNPVWIETTVCLYVLYICHPVIRRELQNVVYMKKKSMFKKKGGGSCPQVPAQKSCKMSVDRDVV